MGKVESKPQKLQKPQKPPAAELNGKQNSLFGNTSWLMVGGIVSSSCCCCILVIGFILYMVMGGKGEAVDTLGESVI